MTVRAEIADFLDALLLVYIICIVAWIVASLVFSLGVRVPYSRWSNAILDFLRDVTMPYLNLFRWVPRLGPLDLSPIVAIFALQIVGRIITGIVRGVSGPGLRAAAVMAAVLVLDQGSKLLVRDQVDLGSRDGVFPGVELVHTRNTGVAFSLFQGGGWVLIVFTVVAMLAVLAFFAANPGRPGVWLPVGLLLGGALGNLVDRVLEGAVTDFIDLPLWPAFNVADIAITFGVVSLLYVLERPRAA